MKPSATDLIRDPEFCAASGLAPGYVRDLVATGILKPAVSPRGRGKTRMWTPDQLDRASLVAALMENSISAPKAVQLVNVPDLTSERIVEIANAERSWLLKVYRKTVAVLEAPCEMRGPGWEGACRLLAVDKLDDDGFKGIDHTQTDKHEEWLKAHMAYVDKSSTWLVVDATRTIRNARIVLDVIDPDRAHFSKLPGHSRVVII